MNKSLSFGLAASAFLALSACSDDKKDPPTHAELCEATPITTECLVGKWRFDGIEESVGNIADNSAGTLTLKANGDFVFSGGALGMSEEVGIWTLNGNSITVNHTRNFNSENTGSITITDSANTMRVQKNGEAAFSLYNSPNSVKNPIEKFTWDE